MRITIEIDASDVKRIQKSTGQKKRSLAINKALTEYLRMHEKQGFIERALAGETDFSMTNGEIETRDL